MWFIFNLCVQPLIPSDIIPWMMVEVMPWVGISLILGSLRSSISFNIHDFVITSISFR